MTPSQLAIVTVGAFGGGFVSGLAGFGTGITAMGIWLHAIPPPIAGPLVAICSVVSQLQTIQTVWHSIRPRKVLPFIIPGLLGVPIGTQMLIHIDTDTFRQAIGVLLLGFSAFTLAWRGRLRITWGGTTADATIGLVSGVLGGMAGLSGVLPTMWASVRGWGKDERRSLFQSFNLSILLLALLTHALTGHLTAEVGYATLAALPGTIAGAWFGARVYRRLSDQHFHTVILCLLAVSGLTLVWPIR